jgi:hypothetical protein
LTRSLLDAARAALQLLELQIYLLVDDAVFVSYHPTVEDKARQRPKQTMK